MARCDVYGIMFAHNRGLQDLDSGGAALIRLVGRVHACIVHLSLRLHRVATFEFWVPLHLQRASRPTKVLEGGDRQAKVRARRSP